MKSNARACICGMIGGAVGWVFGWLLLDVLGQHSFVHPDDGVHAYLTGLGAISGYAAGRWGWAAMMRMTDDWQDTFGPYPQDPEDRSPAADSSGPQIASQESTTENDSKDRPTC